MRTRIIDSSTYVEALSSNLVGFICICSEKGPDNVPRMTTSASDFLRTYGQPNSARFSQASYVALQYLKTLSNLYVMRVLPDDATYAFKAKKLEAKDTLIPYQVDKDGNKVELAEAQVDNAVLVSVKDLASKDLATIISENITQDEDGNDIKPVIIIPESVELNYTIDPVAKLYGVRGADRTEGTTEVTSMNPSGDVDMAGFKFTGKSFAAAFDDADVIQVSNSVFENLSEAGSNVTVIEFNSANPETSVEVPEDDEVKYVNAVERDYVFNDDVNLAEFHTVPEMEYPLSVGDADIIFYPYGRGEYYNNIGFKLTKARKSYEGAFVLDVYTKSKDSAYPALVESFIVSFDRDAVESSGASIFIEDVLDRYSEYLRCKCSENIGSYEEDSGESEDGSILGTTVSYDNLAMTEIEYLSGGSDGAMYTKSGALDWNVMTPYMRNAYLGLNINPETGEDNSFVVDTEDMEYSVVFDFGAPTAVKQAIKDLCEQRNTCFGILDNGEYTTSGNKNAKAALDMRLTDHNWSDYRIALYEPYTKIYDAYTGKYVWITPIYHVVDLMVKTARDYDIFWAFA